MKSAADSNHAKEATRSGAQAPVSERETGGAKAGATHADRAEPIAEKAERLQDDLSAMIETLSERVAEITRQTEVLAAQKRGATQDALADLADECSAYVRQKPLQSMAIAAAAGALLALLLGRRD